LGLGFFNSIPISFNAVMTFLSIFLTGSTPALHAILPVILLHIASAILLLLKLLGQMKSIFFIFICLLLYRKDIWSNIKNLRFNGFAH